MTVKYFALLTNLGAAKLANAAALGTQLQITHMAVGDGGGVLPTPNPAQTKLIAEKRRAALNSLSIDEANSSQIIAEQVIPETDGGWWIREVGLFDKDGILIAIANCPDTYKPQLQEGSGRTQTVRMVLIISSTDAVTLKIDPSVVLATRQYVDKKTDDKAIEVKQYADSLLTEHETSRNHPDASKTEKGFVKLSSATTSDSEALAATPKAVKTVADNVGKALDDHGKAESPHSQYLQIKKFLSEIKTLGPAALTETLENLDLIGGLSTGAIGRLIAKRSITSSGVIPKAAGAKWAIIRAWSAGGGGGGAGRTGTAGNASQGWAGQSGSFIEVLVDVSVLSNYDCFIGLGGLGGAPSNVNAGNPGLDGGDTIITGILRCPGGKGGQPGVLGTTNNTGIATVGTASPTATLGTILDSSISDIGAPGAQVGTGPNQSLGCRGGSAPGGLGSVGGQAGRPIDAGTDGTGGNGNGHAAGGGGGSSVTNTTGYGGGNGTGGFISITEFA
ncbi:TPA: phage tail protein [Yersinia enterocolitica]